MPGFQLRLARGLQFARGGTRIVWRGFCCAGFSLPKLAVFADQITLKTGNGMPNARNGALMSIKPDGRSEITAAEMSFSGNKIMMQQASPRTQSRPKKASSRVLRIVTACSAVAHPEALGPLARMSQIIAYASSHLPCLRP